VVNAHRLRPNPPRADRVRNSPQPRQLTIVRHGHARRVRPVQAVRAAGMVAAKARMAKAVQRVPVTARARVAVHAVQLVTALTLRAATQHVAARASPRTLRHSARAGHHVIDVAKVALKRAESGRVLAMIDLARVATIAALERIAAQIAVASAAVLVAIHGVAIAEVALAVQADRPTVGVNRAATMAAAELATAARHVGVGAIAAMTAALATVAAPAADGAILAAVAAVVAAGAAQVARIDAQHRAARAPVRVAAIAAAQRVAAAVAIAAARAPAAAARARAVVSAIAMHSPASHADFQAVAGRNPHPALGVV
jgi:hypothetical protein